MFKIEAQKPAHAAPLETLLDAAFGPNRLGKRSYAYRDGIDDVAGLRFVALEGGDELVGTIRFWPVSVGPADDGSDTMPALLLGPLGVSPARQGAGIGAALIERGLAAARQQGHTACALVGPLHYYGRFGFAPASVFGISMPGEQQHRLLMRELQNDALAGITGEIRRAERIAPVYSAASA